MKSPRFSIILPAYNVSEFVEATLKCIIGQSFRNFECIIVNDGSTDDTEVKIKKMIGTDKRFKIITQANGGLANARNTGFDNSAGEYVLYLDGDDLFEKSLLKVVDERIASTSADVVIYNSDGLNHQTGQFSGVPNIVSVGDYVGEHEIFSPENISDRLFNTFFNSVWSKVFRRKLLLDNGIRFDDDLRRIEDLPFTNAALAAADTITFIDKVLLHYRYNVQSSNTVNNYKYHMDIISSARRLHDFLNSKQLLSKYRQSFDNAIINDCEYYLWWLSLYPQGAETFLAIKKMLYDFGINSRPKDYFYKEDYFNLKEVIADGTYEDYLRYVLRYLRDVQRTSGDELERRQAAIDELTTRTEHQEQTIGELRMSVEQKQQDVDRLHRSVVDLLQSKSYRLGRLMTKPVRVVIDHKKIKQ